MSLYWSNIIIGTVALAQTGENSFFPLVKKNTNINVFFDFQLKLYISKSFRLKNSESYN